MNGLELRWLRLLTLLLLVIGLFGFVVASSALSRDGERAGPPVSAERLGQGSKPGSIAATAVDQEPTQSDKQPSGGKGLGTDGGHRAEQKSQTQRAPEESKGPKKPQPDAELQPEQKPKPQEKTKPTEKPELKKQQKPAGKARPRQKVAAKPAGKSKPSGKYYCAIDEIRVGMKGYGLSVFKGTKIDKFEAEVLGIQRNVAPGRDMVLVRLRGCGLEHTGVIAGMSGSPIYIDGKMLGAIAYTWSFGKEPIAGVTPFCQMLGYAQALQSAASQSRRGASAGRTGSPGVDVRIWSRPFPVRSVTQVAATRDQSAFGLTQVKVPLISSGFPARTVAQLESLLGSAKFIPAIGGDAPEEIVARAGAEPIRPGSPLVIALITGDFDLSSLGTVTHVDGDRLYGFGHPMLGSGKCELPLMSGYVYFVYPRQTTSFKMGAPLRIVGVIDTDVSTCVAGQLGTTPRMIPMEVSVRRAGEQKPREYRVKLIRDPDWLPRLVLAVLTAAVDAEGELPDEVTLRVQAEIKPQGHRTLILNDVYSGSIYSGPSGAAFAYNVIPNLIDNLLRNDIKKAEIEWLRCSTEVIEGRTSASIRQVRLNSDVFEPGEELVAHVQVEPYKGAPRWLTIELRLPDELRPGTYRALLCDALTAINDELASKPYLLDPQNLDQLYHVLELQLAEHRKNLYLRVGLPDAGVSQGGAAMPDLPLCVAQILTRRRSTPPTVFRAAISARLPTEYVIQGSRSVYFNVVTEKGFYEQLSARHSVRFPVTRRQAR